MPKGHKEDCQCGICKRVRAKSGAVAVMERPPEEREEPAPPEAVEPAITLGSLPIGTVFRHGPRVLKKLNNPGTVADPGTMDDAFTLPPNTAVQLLPKLPDIQQDMDA